MHHSTNSAPMNFSYESASTPANLHSAAKNCSDKRDRRGSSEVETPGSLRRLDQIAAQLAELNTEDRVDGSQQNARPEVVFLDAAELAPQQIIEVTLAEGAPLESVRQALANEPEQLDGQPVAELPAEDRYREPFRPASAEESFRCIDPFAYEADGAMPIMTSLPMLDAERMTSEVVARETAGQHHAWTLATAENSPQRNLDLTLTNRAKSSFVESAATLDGKVSGAADSVEDCFYAEPGQVIFVDGNQGFDHIDLRSYDINCATFQPEAIVLHASIDPSQVAKADELMEPITIRHRGVEFAIFHGEVRVEL